MANGFLLHAQGITAELRVNGTIPEDLDERDARLLVHSSGEIAGIFYPDILDGFWTSPNVTVLGIRREPYNSITQVPTCLRRENLLPGQAEWNKHDLRMGLVLTAAMSGTEYVRIYLAR